MNYFIDGTEAGMHPKFQQDPIEKKLHIFSFPTAIIRMKKKIITNVRTPDVHLMAIREYKDTPQFFYTIGLFHHFQHPEILIMGVDVNVAHDILMRAHALIKSGGTIQPWNDLPRDMTHTPMRSVPVDASHYSNFLGFGMWFYKSLGGSKPDAFPALQFVWPDVMNEIYPWENGYGVGFFSEQQLLCGEQELKQALERNA